MTSVTEFNLHKALQKDCFEVAQLPLCSILLMNDSQYPWLILVPRVANITELIELSDEQQQQLWQESALISRGLKYIFSADKLNIAALGNMVPQLHLHHIARFKHDPAWPKPVWGLLPAQPYTQHARNEIITKIRHWLDEQSC